MDICKVETNKQLSNGNSKGQEDLADETAGDEVELLDSLNSNKSKRKN